VLRAMSRRFRAQAHVELDGPYGPREPDAVAPSPEPSAVGAPDG
jgi:hypothetical protein